MNLKDVISTLPAFHTEPVNLVTVRETRRKIKGGGGQTLSTDYVNNVFELLVKAGLGKLVRGTNDRGTIKGWFFHRTPLPTVGTVTASNLLLQVHLTPAEFYGGDVVDAQTEREVAAASLLNAPGDHGVPRGEVPPQQRGGGGAQGGSGQPWPRGGGGGSADEDEELANMVSRTRLTTSRPSTYAAAARSPEATSGAHTERAPITGRTHARSPGSAATPTDGAALGNTRLTPSKQKEKSQRSLFSDNSMPPAPNS